MTSDITDELPLKFLNEIDGEYLSDERMGHIWRRGLYPEIAFESCGAALESDDGLYFSDDFEFPQTAHRAWASFTPSLFVLVIVTFGVWGGWNLISLIVTLLL